MRKARAALALLLAFAVPVRAETTADPLWYLLSTYVLAPDSKAVEAQGDGPADSKGLAALQADLLVLTDGFEGFRDEAQVKETLERLKPRMSPELRPFFKDRASSLDAIYRTLAVTDYTWAQRFPEPPCEPAEARRKLLSRPFEQAANEVCGNDRPCKDEVLLNLDYDFRSCLKRWDQDGSGSPGSLGTPSLNIPRNPNRTRCVPIQKTRAKPLLRGVWLSNNPDNDSGEGQDDAPASPGDSDLIAIIVNKLNYLFGKATGDAKNIQRSKEMLRSLERIGLNDTPKNREHVKSQLKGVMKNPSAVAKIQLNSRIVKESVLAGPRGVIKMISIWNNGRLITVLFTRS